MSNTFKNKNIINIDNMTSKNECQICYKKVKKYVKDMKKCDNLRCDKKICFECLFKLKDFEINLEYNQYEDELFYSKYNCSFCFTENKERFDLTDITNKYKDVMPDLIIKKVQTKMRRAIKSMPPYIQSFNIVRFLDEEKKYIVILAVNRRLEIIYFTTMINEYAETEFKFNENNEKHLLHHPPNFKFKLMFCISKKEFYDNLKPHIRNAWNELYYNEWNDNRQYKYYDIEQETLNDKKQFEMLNKCYNEDGFYDTPYIGKVKTTD